MAISFGNEGKISADTLRTGYASTLIEVSRDTSEAAKADASQKLADYFKVQTEKQPSILDRLKELPDTSGSKKINFPDYIQAKPQQIVDKDGVVRDGFLVKNEPLSLEERLEGKKAKPLAKVKEVQVTKFLDSIKSLGLDLKVEDIMSSNGTLNPNFEVDEKGNISFRNVKDFINGKAPEYFETIKGEWARAAEKKGSSWLDKFKPIEFKPEENFYPGLEIDRSKLPCLY